MASSVFYSVEVERRRPQCQHHSLHGRRSVRLFWQSQCGRFKIEFKNLNSNFEFKIRAVGVQLELGGIEEAEAACERLALMGQSPEVYQQLGERLRRVAGWLSRRATVGLHQQAQGRLEGVWSGAQARCP